MPFLQLCATHVCFKAVSKPCPQGEYGVSERSVVKNDMNNIKYMAVVLCVVGSKSA